MRAVFAGKELEEPSPSPESPASSGSSPPEADRPGLTHPLVAEPVRTAPEARWVPLIPGAQAIPSGVSTRSGAFLMAATRDPPGGPTPVRPAPDLDSPFRSALVSCLEALAPQLEPGWSHCTEHPGCRAVQEATGVLWGRAPTDPRDVAASPPESPPTAPGAAASGPRPASAPAATYPTP